MQRFIKSIAAFMLIVTAMFVVGCTKPEDLINEVDNGGNGEVVDDHVYVDLGLPSGLLWATCNVGANAPEEYGDYFSWGETQPKDIYDWPNYRYFSGSDNSLLFTKYCSESYWGYNGFVDSLTVLEPSDDVATVNWGADWRMPTKEECRELYLNTTVIGDTTLNDVAGVFFIAGNGNSIFLPTASYHWCDEFCDQEVYGYNGYYWTRTLGIESPEGWALCLYSDGSSYHFYMDQFGRYAGFSVRPVTSGR